MLDANCANYRQLNSRQFTKFASRPYPCPSVVKNFPCLAPLLLGAFALNIPA